MERKTKAPKEAIMSKKNIEFGVLTKNQIQEKKIIISDDDLQFNKSCYASASYDLRINTEYIIPGENKIKNSEKIICPYHKMFIKNEVINCKKDNNIIKIPAFSSIIFCTYESLSIPNNVIGRFDLMVKWALQGLILQVGTQVEPYYKGKLFGLLHNFSDKEICIPYKERLLTIEFSFTSQIAEPKINPKQLNDINDFKENFNVVQGSLENFLNEIKKIKEIVEKTNNGMTKKLSYSVAIIIGIITLGISVALPLIVTKLTFDRDDYPYPKSNQIEYIQKKNDSLKKEVFQLNEKLLKYGIVLDSIKKKSAANR